MFRRPEMKRLILILLSFILIVVLSACTTPYETKQLDDILNTLYDIRDTIDTIPPSLFQPPLLPDEDGTVFLAEDSDFLRRTKTGTLTVGMVRNSAAFDPCLSSFAAGMDLVYDTLFSAGQDGEICGVLAEEWEYRDETHLYIKLRDASFSIGDPVTAEDCLWSLKRFADSDSRWRHLFDFLDFENSKTLSKTEFVLAMKDEFAPAFRYLSSYFSSILDKDYCTSVGEDAFLTQPIGSGPYTYTAGETESEYTFDLRDDYWDTENVPRADRIRIRLYDDSAAMLVDYEAGDLDMAFCLDSTDAKRLLNGDIADTNYVIRPEKDVYSLFLPEHVEAFSDVRVRHAIALAVDWNAVRESGMGILCRESDSVLPADVFGKVSCGTYAYDPDAAMVLLDEAGYDYGQSFEFVVGNSDADIRMAKTIQHDLASVGINVHIDICEPDEAEIRFRNGETDLLLYRYDVPVLDPDQAFDAVSSWSENDAVRISEEPLPTYLTIGRWSADASIREESYFNAQAWMYEYLRQIAFAEPYGCYCWRPYIDSGFRCDSVFMPNLRLVCFLDS